MKNICMLISSAFVMALIQCGNTAGGEGNFKIKLTDAPLEDSGRVVTAVNVVIEKITVKGNAQAEENAEAESENSSEKSSSSDKQDETDTAENEGGGFFVITETEQKVNLMDLLNDATTLLGEVKLAAGKYSEIRVQVAEENTIEFEDAPGIPETLKIPSGTSSGIKIKTDFKIEDNKDTEILLDFDAQESVSESNQTYILRPVIKVKDKKEAL